MATLHVRNVPDELYARLHRFASSDNQSLTGEVVALLSQAIETRELREGQKAVLSNLRRRRFKAPGNAPDSTSLLQEDRAR